MKSKYFIGQDSHLEGAVKYANLTMARYLSQGGVKEVVAMSTCCEKVHGAKHKYVIHLIVILDDE
jgi:hypothetical protein